ncbi:maleylacetate reductase [Fusarium heterosporum]|uniref:Maleylacetate reductase n=1 Tax=Fusarium heterosporum TaxID=42747 RepID=A0A8H5T8T7_FUSHE|nr:maleylacetate reductase [Fusarium heterosporum]
MRNSTSAIQRPEPQKATDPDLVAVRAKLLGALAVKGPILVTPPATNLSPRSSYAGPSGTAQQPRSRSRHRRTPHHSSPRVVVGPNTIQRLPSELARLNLVSPLIVTSPSRLNLARRIQAIVPNLDTRILSSSVTTARTRISGRDCVISVGGGSAVTLARAMGLRKGIPHVCIPTTYSGSELNPGGGPSNSTTEDEDDIGRSKTLPAVIIYDDNLTMSHPTRFAAPSDAKVLEDFARADHSVKPEDACWSYLHLPGV